MSPATADGSAPGKVEESTLRTLGATGSAGTARVVALTVVIVDPPSGSLSVSSISYVVAGARSRTLPECLFDHEKPTLVPAGTRRRGMPMLQAPAPSAR